jgi:hypothetical protein
MHTKTNADGSETVTLTGAEWDRVAWAFRQIPVEYFENEDNVALRTAAAKFGVVRWVVQ